MAFGTIHRTPYDGLAGDTRKRSSSDFGSDFGGRWFCGHCHSPLAMLVTHQPGTIDIPLATLDDPGVAAPEFHIWASCPIASFETGDGLPKHLRVRPDTPGLASQVAEGAPISSPSMTIDAAS